MKAVRPAPVVLTSLTNNVPEAVKKVVPGLRARVKALTDTAGEPGGAQSSSLSSTLGFCLTLEC